MALSIALAVPAARVQQLVAVGQAQEVAGLQLAAQVATTAQEEAVVVMLAGAGDAAAARARTQRAPLEPQHPR